MKKCTREESKYQDLPELFMSLSNDLPQPLISSSDGLKQYSVATFVFYTNYLTYGGSPS